MVEEKNDGDGLRRSVELRQRRETRWRRDGERPIWRNLSMIGAFGWLIVVPILLGAIAGRWLDSRTGGGLFWTGGLIVAGATLGLALVWQRIKKED